MKLPTIKNGTFIPHLLLIALYALPAVLASLPHSGSFLHRVAAHVIQPPHSSANVEILEIM